MTIASTLSARQWAYLALSGLLLVAAVLFFGAHMSRAESSSVMITSSDANPTVAKVGDTVTLSFITSASTTNPTVAIEGHSVGVSGGPTNWTASYTIQASDPAGIVPFVIDASGTVLTSTTNNSSVVVYNGGPTVVLTTPSATEPNRTNQTTVPVMVTFSEPVLGFSAGNLKTPEASVSNFAAQPGGQIYTFDLTLNPQYNTFFAYVKADQVTDAAGNYNSYSNELSFLYSPTGLGEGPSNMGGVVMTQSAPHVTVTTVTTTPPPQTEPSLMTGTAAGTGNMTTHENSMPAGMVMSATPPSTRATSMTSSTSGLMGTSSNMMASSSASTTPGTSGSGLGSPAVWAGIIIILILLIGGGWWYSRNVTPTV